MTKKPNAFNLAGKKGLILGLANENSIAWGCTELAHQMGAVLVVSCLNEKARRFVEPLTGPLGVDLVGCNVEPVAPCNDATSYGEGIDGPAEKRSRTVKR